MKEAVLYSRDRSGNVSCRLCSHFCFIPEGETGFCRVRLNQNGTLFSLNYGELAARNIDPVEKKPLFHFYPGSLSYSIASLGCNFRCAFCQNWEISQKQESDRLFLKTESVSPEDVVSQAQKYNCRTIACTYTEPTVYFEFAEECAQLAEAQGISTVFVTNGYMSREALDRIGPVLDAANIDLKSFRDSFYRETCKASLKPVLETIQEMKKRNIWVEITTLIVPGSNDSVEELSDIAGFISSLDKNIPWHVSRFYPQYKMDDLPPTPAETLETAFNIGKEKGLNYIYLGNLRTETGENTYCPVCGRLLIERCAFSLLQNNLVQGKCPFCRAAIPGRFL